MLELAKAAIAIAVFSVAAVMDWRRREIHELTWAPSIVGGALINVAQWIRGIGGSNPISHLRLLQLGASLALLLVVIVLFLLKLVGGADVLAIAALVSLYPYSALAPEPHLGLSPISLMARVLPPTASVLALYAVIMAAYLLYNATRNLYRRRALAALSLPPFKRLVVVVFHRVMTVEEFLRSRFYFPVIIPGLLERHTFDVDEDDAAWRAKLSHLPQSTVIVASWGVPMVSFLSVAVLIYVSMALLHV